MVGAAEFVGHLRPNPRAKSYMEVIWIWIIRIQIALLLQVYFLVEKRDLQQGQDGKEIHVQLNYSVFNLRMVGGRNRIQGQQNRFKEMKIQINRDPVLLDTLVGDYEDTVAITANLFAEVFISSLFSSLNVWQRKIVEL